MQLQVVSLSVVFCSLFFFFFIMVNVCLQPSEHYIQQKILRSARLPVKASELYECAIEHKLSLLGSFFFSSPAALQPFIVSQSQASVSHCYSLHLAFFIYSELIILLKSFCICFVSWLLFKFVGSFISFFFLLCPLSLLSVLVEVGGEYNTA